VQAERDQDAAGPAKEWMGKCVDLRKELDTTVEGAVRLDRRLKLTMEDNDLLRVQFQAGAYTRPLLGST
jgi:hypothetical protein